jgi:hypothetical protein
MTVISIAQRAFPGFSGGGRTGRRMTISPRTLAPFVLIPLGTLYCQIHELFFGEIRSAVGESLVWASATLTPWVIAVLIFEARVAAGEQRYNAVRRALLLGVCAYAGSCVAAFLLGASGEQALFSRLPLLATAILCAVLYPIPMPAEARSEAVANDSVPPVAPAEIVFARAAGNYIELHARGRTFIWRQTMHSAERILGAGFVRVHRSYLVPWRSIETVTRGRKGPIEVALNNGACLPVSNRYAANLHS